MVEQHLKAREQRYVKRGSMRSREGVEFARQGSAQLEVVRLALKTLGQGAGLIDRQINDRQVTAQLLLPVGPQMFTFLALQHLCLPASVICVLQSKREKDRLAARNLGLIY